jgi:hypothetical protein
VDGGGHRERKRETKSHMIHTYRSTIVTDFVAFTENVSVVVYSSGMSRSSIQTHVELSTAAIVI